MKHRPSILARSRRPQSKAHLESIDVEFANEKRKLEAKRARYEESLAERRKNMFATPEERQNRICEAMQFMEKERQFAHQARLREIEDEKRRVANSQAHMMEVEENEDLEESIRREYMYQLMEENKKLAQYRRALHEQKRRGELAEERRAPNFYDRWGRNAV